MQLKEEYFVKYIFLKLIVQTNSKNKYLNIWFECFLKISES